MLSAISFASTGGVNPSNSPTMTRVGQVISFKRGTESGPPFGAVGLRPGVGQHQPLHPSGVLPIERKHHVATHGETGQDRLLDGEMVQEAFHVVGELVHSVQPQRRVRLAVPTKVHGDDPELTR